MQKTAIITGSSKGIGKSIAYELAKNGYDLVINSRNQQEANVTAKEISDKTGVTAIGIAADVRDSSQVNRLVKKTIDKFGRIDVLVNNAGILVVESVVDTTETHWDDVIDTNLKGTYLCTRTTIPQMILQNSGCIVNISSGAGKSGFAELSAYCASKFGMIGFAQSVMNEVTSNNISVVTICPGSVATDMQLQLMSKKEYESRKDSMIQPQEIAKQMINAINDKVSGEISL